MKLYHGSTLEVRKPLLRYGRERTDFGKGFYTTTQPEQAERWAGIKKDRTNSAKATVSTYEFDESVLTDQSLRIREFHGVDESWLNFVVDCRKGEGQKHDFDIVLGPVADDNVFTTVNLYESGLIDTAAAIAQLKAYKTYDQISFHSEKAIEKLRFTESYIL